MVGVVFQWKLTWCSICKFGILCNVVLILSVLPIYAFDNLPPEINNICEKRERDSGNLTFSWRVTSTKTTIPRAQADVDREIANLTPQSLASFKLPPGELPHIRDFLSSRASSQSVSFTNTWQFANSNGQIVVSGTTVDLPPDNVKTIFCHLYRSRSAIVIPEKVESTYAKRIVPGAAQVWGTPEDSFRFQNPFQSGLGLWPEDFVLVSQKNPVAIYGATWQLVKTTQDEYWIETTVKQGNFAPYTVRMVLSRNHDELPSKIIATHALWNMTYTVNRYRKISGNWIPEQIDNTWKFNQRFVQKRTWELIDAVPTPTQSVLNSLHPNVLDYRLLGDHLTTSDIVNAETVKDLDIVNYRWEGDFPSQHRLEVLRAQQGGAAPRGSSSGYFMTWFPGIALVVVGTLWSLWLRVQQRQEKIQVGGDQT